MTPEQGTIATETIYAALDPGLFHTVRIYKKTSDTYAVSIDCEEIITFPSSVLGSFSSDLNSWAGVAAASGYVYGKNSVLI